MQFSHGTDRWRVPHRKTGREPACAPPTLLPSLTARLGSHSRKKGDRMGRNLRAQTLETPSAQSGLTLSADVKAMPAWPAETPGFTGVTRRGRHRPSTSMSTFRSFTHAPLLLFPATSPGPHLSAYFYLLYIRREGRRI